MHKALVVVLIVGLLVSGCTSEIVDEAGEDDAGTDALNDDIGEFDDFEQELDELEDIDLDELDF